MPIPNLTTGLDVSDRYSTFFTLDADGEVEEEGRMRTTSPALRIHFAGPRRRVVLEAGPHSPWISRLLAELGHEVIVANARMVALIHKNPKKSDPVDAESLARLGRVDPKLLAPIEHRSEEAQIHLGVIRTRAAVVCARTALVNHVRGTVKALGGRIPKCSTHSFPRKAAEHIPGALRPGLEPVLETNRRALPPDSSPRTPDRRALRDAIPRDRLVPADQGCRASDRPRLPARSRRPDTLREESLCRTLPWTHTPTR